MAFSNIDSLNLGELLQIAFSDGIRNQVSTEHKEFEMIQSKKAGSNPARELRFMLQETLAPSSVGYLSSTTSAFPTSYQVDIDEYTAKMKEISATMSIETNLWRRAEESPTKYGMPVLIQADSVIRSSKRRIAADTHGDGTGVIGTIASVDDTNINSSSASIPYSIEVTLSTTNAARGFIGWFEIGDLYLVKTAAGAAQAPASGSNFAAFKCRKKDRVNNKVTLQLVQSDGKTVATGYSIGTVGAADLIYRANQLTIPDLSSAPSTDYNLLTEIFVGLETLAANDGRVVHGMTLNGALGSTVYDNGGNALDLEAFQGVMDQVKVNVGNVYAWKKALMAPEARSTLVLSKEADRRFNAHTDATRGSPSFTFVHDDDVIEFMTTEFTRKDRVWVCPEDNSGDGKVLELHMCDFTPVTLGGQDMFLLPGSDANYSRNVFKAWEGYLTMINKHPASIARIENFTV